jgi:hypothetical protein
MQDFMKENAGVGAEGVNDSAWGAGGADECGSALNRFLDTSPLVTAAQPSASAQPGKRRSAAAVQNAAKAVSRRQRKAKRGCPNADQGASEMPDLELDV